jgi:P27 family predicted phage terminase small subunit
VPPPETYPAEITRRKPREASLEQQRAPSRSAMPDCPPELGPVAKQEWDRLAAQLGPLRMITHLDRAALASYCAAYALWAEATQAIQTYGAMVKSPSGYPVQSPYVSIANRQTEIMMRIASEFGLTPASRSRISAPAAAQPSLFDETPTQNGKDS